jgi:hypothetical protein
MRITKNIWDQFLANLQHDEEHTQKNDVKQIVQHHTSMSESKKTMFITQ